MLKYRPGLSQDLNVFGLSPVPWTPWPCPGQVRTVVIEEFLSGPHGRKGTTKQAAAPACPHYPDPPCHRQTAVKHEGQWPSCLSRVKNSSFCS